MSYEILQVNPVLRVRAVSEESIFIGEFESQTPDTLASLFVVDRKCGKQIPTTPNHYFQFGKLQE